MERIGAVLDSLEDVVPWGKTAEFGKCRRCGIEFMSIPAGVSDQLCRDCEAGAERSAGLVALRGVLVETELADAGLGKRERLSEVAKIPDSVRRQLPGAAVKALLAGERPEIGFGLSGTPGIGKTMAMASLIAEHGRARILRIAAEKDSRRTRGWLAWAPWKAVTERIRAMSTVDGGFAKVDELIAGFCSTEVLVLDDLGSERIRGSYADDWATSQLDRIIDERDRNMQPIWYTTNLGRAAIEERYGSRLWSRLSAVAPLVELGAGRDLRMVR